jgi:uroporphyrinogen decarboxylase
MNSKEIIKRTLEFTGPERVGRSFSDSDLVWCDNTVKTHATDWIHVGDNRWERRDEWGNLWARVDSTSKGEVVEGILSEIEDIDSYIFPDYSDYKDYNLEIGRAHV